MEMKKNLSGDSGRGILTIPGNMGVDILNGKNPISTVTEGVRGSMNSLFNVGKNGVYSMIRGTWNALWKTIGHLPIVPMATTKRH